MNILLRAPVAAALVLSAQPSLARETLQDRVQARLAQAAAGTRFGLVVADDTGRELVAISPDDRFIPASNTKMFTTAAGFAFLPAVNQPDQQGGAQVALERRKRGGTDVVLTGNGDARLSSTPECVTDCLAALADAVAARTRRVNDIVGDDTLFPVQRWSPGMSWNNIPSGDGTGVSALTLDDNRIVLRITAATPGQPPVVDLLPYYQVDNQAVTVASGKTDLEVTRLPFEWTVRLLGTIVAGEEAAVENLGIDDPAHYAAWRLKTLLEARGVKVRGEIRMRHRPFASTDDPKKRGDALPTRPARAEALARVTPPPVAEDIVTINKISQNLHAELMLRRVGLIRGTGSIEDGQAMVQSMLASAGVPRTGFDFSDGSGMSNYNRVAPRSAVKFLRWVAAQPWGAAWRASLPVAGFDGTLRNRFKGTWLHGRLFAKTGTLNATRALSGYMIAKSGRTLTFSMFANDEPSETSARETMEAALEIVANEN
jgi:D-alanyl-D-alanine carboxypeptidase/D-alanyl-D-alanine-endopeptidase (penicillin-binding protein 4)